ncbi:MAG: Maf family protein [Candidatus Symbiothrix sp.]|jgi:predicted house-cleaning NTP pyrophosphatase (Maf/HAM1 superfamily)|nr:Maf family protein [Candidatus Symbiothrix sp.]
MLKKISKYDIILGSGSPIRRKLLSSSDLRFETRSKYDIEEKKNNKHSLPFRW